MPIPSSAALPDGATIIPNGASVTQEFSETSPSDTGTDSGGRSGNLGINAAVAEYAANFETLRGAEDSPNYGFLNSAKNNVIVNAGTILEITSTGTANGGTVGGLVIVESGGTIEGATFTGAPDGNPLGANAYLNYGASAKNNTVMDGAVLSENCGAYGIANNTAMHGGTIALGNGTLGFKICSLGKDGKLHSINSPGLGYGMGAGDVAIDGGVIHVSGYGLEIGATVREKGTLQVDAGGTVKGAIIGAGMDNWAGGASVQDQGQDGASVAAGGTLDRGVLEDGKGTGSTVETMGGLLRVQPGATITNLQIGNYGQIEVVGMKYNAGESVVYTNQNGTQAITLMSNGQPVMIDGKPWSMTLAPPASGGTYVGSDFKIWQDSDGNAVIVYDRCFLSGTKILTPKGDIPVERLTSNDKIITYEQGKEIIRPIRYVHRKHSKISAGLPKDLAGYAICIKKGAFKENLPENDLWVTPEHSFLFAGKLVPIRMLVNGKSVYYDLSRTDFEYFHIETEPHAIIKAEGVLTESWLNTNTRREAVRLNESITRLDIIPPRTWEEDAAAPLEVSQNFVEPLWREIAARAERLHLPAVFPEPEISFSQDPSLRIKLENGREIFSTERRGKNYIFKLPAKAGALKLVSHLFRPSDSIGPWLDDRRQLGVLVGKITMVCAGKVQDITAHLKGNLSGWDVVETIPCRWTKGRAALPALEPQEKAEEPISLFIEILAGGPYPLSPQAEISAKRA